MEPIYQSDGAIAIQDFEDVLRRAVSHHRMTKTLRKVIRAFWKQYLPRIARNPEVVLYRDRAVFLWLVGGREVAGAEIAAQRIRGVVFAGHRPLRLEIEADVRRGTHPKTHKPYYTFRGDFPRTMPQQFQRRLAQVLNVAVMS